MPGSPHDSGVLKSTELHHNLTRGTLDGVIIGDSAYAAETLLLKPITNPSTLEGDIEDIVVRFLDDVTPINDGFEGTERLPPVHFKYAPAKAAQIVLACCILRNIAIHSELDNYDEYPNANVPIVLEQSLHDGTLYPDFLRQIFTRRIVEKYF
ncbi:unnamed protein product [Heligmosomoides polygyrus]|uniref:DDE Tnp4 domain-containing protein n=1 Tax=Heligmosomoides polygyrus TaxID=6339 RepID=A0A183FT11_HELPZ|nr:unnamed protein product [Heligmosomoides polygyrus]